MPDDPSDEDVVSATDLTQTSSGRRGVRKPAQRGILPIGFVLNGIYEVKRFIARGGMGEVYEGVNVNADERVAVKVILPHLAADPKVQALFRKEAKTLTSLAHPALVQYRVLAREPRKDLLYIVTDFIDGEPLTNLIGRSAPTVAELVMLTRRLAEGLNAAHSHGAIHRDISPENVLLPDGVLSRAKIIDFGIAKSMEIGAQTVVGDGFAGKLGYVAPEQFGDFDRRIGPWTDVYSLGLVILALAGGKAPDMGATLVEAIDRRRAGVDMTAVPPLLQALFARMLNPDPRERPRTMADVLTALNALDVPFEPPSSLSWNAPPGETPSFVVEHEVERTVIHFGSEPPSWQSAETNEHETPPHIADTAEPVAFADIVQEATPTIFAPSASTADFTVDAPSEGSISSELEPEFAPNPEPESEPDPTPASSLLDSTPATLDDDAETTPSELARTVYALSDASTAQTNLGAPQPVDAIKPLGASSQTRPVASALENDEPAILPAMDVSYGSSPREDSPSREAAPARAPLKGKVAAAGVVVAVVVAGVGFAVLNGQKKPVLPSLAPRASVAPNVSRAEDAIAASLPGVPCSWLVLSHGQNADGSTSIKVSGAAGDPVAANRTVAGAAQATGAAGLQVDTTEILTADQASCPLLNTISKFRGPRTAVPSLVAQQSRFEIDRGIQGCPSGLWAQSMITVSPDPSKAFSLIAIQPSGRLEQFAANREQFAALAARNPDLYKDLGGGRYRVSICQSAPGLAGVLMIEGAAPFDLGLRPGAQRPARDFPTRLGQLAQERGWTMQMAWFQLVNDQPDLPEKASLNEAEMHRRMLAEAAKKAAADAAVAPPVIEVAAPAAEPAKLPADYVPCRAFVGGAWEELGYAPQSACVDKVFAGRCDVLTGQAGDIALRRYGQRLQAKTGRGFNKWTNVGKSDCSK